jgi:hypothetical protein
MHCPRWFRSLLPWLLLSTACVDGEASEEIEQSSASLVTTYPGTEPFDPVITPPPPPPATSPLPATPTCTPKYLSQNSFPDLVSYASGRIPAPELRTKDSWRALVGPIYEAVYECPTPQKVYELDAPHKTANGTFYYSFSATVFLHYRGGLVLRTIDAANRIAELPIVNPPWPSPSVNYSSFLQLRTACATQSSNLTQRDYPTACLTQSAELEAGRIVAYREHAPYGSVLADNGEYSQLHFLIPASKLGRILVMDIYGRYGGTATTFGNQLTLKLVPSPRSVMVLGDSMAWGQGLRPAEKPAEQFVAALNVANATGIPTLSSAPTRLDRYAHSAAKTGWGAAGSFGSYSNFPSTATGDFGRDPCATKVLRAGDYWGEVFSSYDTTACQIRNAGIQPGVIPTQPYRLVTLALQGNSTVQVAATSTTLPPRLNLPSGPTDRGPRYDYVFISSCLNDVGAAHLLNSDRARVAEAIDAACRQQLAGKLAFVGQQFPEATIVLNSYHQVFSADAFSVATGSFAVPLPLRTELSLLYELIPAPVPAALLFTYDLNGLRWVEANTAEAKRRLDASVLAAASALSSGAGGRVVGVDYPLFVNERATFGNDAHAFGVQFDQSAAQQVFTRAVERVRLASIARVNAFQAQIDELRRQLEALVVDPTNEAKRNELLASIDALLNLQNLAQLLIGECMAFATDPVAYLSSKIDGMRQILKTVEANTKQMMAELLTAAIKPVDPIEIRNGRATACAAVNSDPIERAKCNLASAFHPNPRGATHIVQRQIEVLRARGKFPSPAP